MDMNALTDPELAQRRRSCLDAKLRAMPIAMIA